MMRERAESVGGRLEVATAPGGGTRLRLEVPSGLEFGASPR
jgi:signal transduction histidine kinase